MSDYCNFCDGTGRVRQGYDGETECPYCTEPSRYGLPDKCQSCNSPMDYIFDKEEEVIGVRCIEGCGWVDMDGVAHPPETEPQPGQKMNLFWLGETCPDCGLYVDKPDDCETIEVRGQPGTLAKWVCSFCGGEWETRKTQELLEKLKKLPEKCPKCNGIFEMLYSIVNTESAIRCVECGLVLDMDGNEYQNPMIIDPI